MRQRSTLLWNTRNYSKSFLFINERRYLIVKPSDTRSDEHADPLSSCSSRGISYRFANMKTVTTVSSLPHLEYSDKLKYQKRRTYCFPIAKIKQLYYNKKLMRPSGTTAVPNQEKMLLIGYLLFQKLLAMKYNSV